MVPYLIDTEAAAELTKEHVTRLSGKRTKYTPQAPGIDERGAPTKASDDGIWAPRSSLEASLKAAEKVGRVRSVLLGW